MFKFDNSYAKLPEQFFQSINPTPVKNPSLIKINQELASELGLEIQEAEAAEIFSGNKIVEGSEPLAQAYAGHQFGHFVPQLGDGRACLLGEVIDTSGQRKDIQLKGSGQTRFSRAGDGRAALGPVIREYIVSEAMHALGVPTTRSLAIVASGEEIYRETTLPGAILTRVAASHIRVGTFEYFIQRQDFGALKTLANYVIDRHYPEIKNSQNPYQELLRAVSLRQAKLVAQWTNLGFIHGVMNTDNCSIAGETIDYGPCAFMDFFNPAQVFSSIDKQGRYAYQQQGLIGQWNMSILANALLPLIDSDQNKAIDKAKMILEEYAAAFLQELDFGSQCKIGIQNKIGDKLAKNLLTLMYQNRADFNLSYRYLTNMVTNPSFDTKFLALFDKNELDLLNWIKEWRVALKQENNDLETIAFSMKQINPAFIPRNYKVEEVIRAAQNNDFTPFETLTTVLKNPYIEQEQYLDYMLPPQDKNQQYQTFCGT